ncbi:MAG TPA: ABC transporter ATP-binding protein [Pseudomonadales bacterium]|nr:ABC transporter ATP-binding protein [Pseudomonadales bacterium]
MMHDATLSLRDISMSFQPGRPVLDQIGLELEAGSVTGLLGKNGAGKTTLMRIALGLLRPDAGAATLFGEPAWDAAPDIRKRIGYVAQGETPFNWMRLGDCLKLVGSFYEDWDDKLVKRYLAEWDLDPSSYIQDLSTGQRQKVSILAAIGHHPDLLVLDEPVASLDPGARRQFLKALVELNQDLSHTILFSTHITSDIERVAADIAVLHEGKLKFRGNLDDMKDKCRKLYFSGSPLPAELHERGIERYVQSGDRATAFTMNWDPGQARGLESSLGIKINDERLPLEDLFLELTHG